MASQSGDIEGFVELVNQLRDEQIGMFDIIGIGRDERAHTRMLAWLLQPNGSHGLGSSVVSAVFTEAGLVAHEALDTATITTFDQQPSDTELDIVLEIGETIVCIEVKTRSRLQEPQYDRQVDYLSNVVDGDEGRGEQSFGTWEYIYLAADAEHDPKYVGHVMTWDDLLDSFSSQVGAVEQDSDAMLLREWTKHVESQLTDSWRFSPASQLLLNYPELVEQFDIDLDPAAVKADRKRILSTYWQWLNETYPAVAEGNEGWKMTRSQVESRTQYIRLAKDRWPTGLRFEVQATMKRMTANTNHSKEHDRYRTRQPHVELTLTYAGVTEEERSNLLEHIPADTHRDLEAHEFELIRDGLPKDCTVDINPYHVYSKQVPLEFSNPDETVGVLKEGTNQLMGLQETLDIFIAD